MLGRFESPDIRRCGRYPLPALDIAVGKWAAPLLRWAKGIDPTPVMPPPAQPALTYSQVLEPDTNDDRILRNYLADLLEQLCRTLRIQQRVCRRLTLTIRYSDHTHTSDTGP